MQPVISRASLVVLAVLIGAACAPSGALAQALIPSRYDIVLKKVRVALGYAISVTNDGADVAGAGWVEFDDQVPAGINVTSITAPAPWVCWPLPPPVLRGPTKIKCEYRFNDLARGATLPDVILRVIGAPNRRHCATARLFTLGPRGSRLIRESDTGNNVGCAS